MKIIVVLFLFLYSISGFSQEIPAVEEAPSSEFLIKRTKIIPSLSILSPEIPNTGRFRIRPVIFETEGKQRQVNISEYLEQEKRRKSRVVGLAPPVVLPEQDDAFTITKNTDWSVRPTRYFNQSFEPNLQQRGAYNSVYKDASLSTGAYYLNRYNPYSPYRRGYYSY